MNRKPIILSKRWSHHSKHSGYDAVANYIPATVISRPEIRSPLMRGAARAWNARERAQRTHAHLLDYQFTDALAEYKSILTAIAQQARVLHSLYADEQLDLLLRHKQFYPGKLLATFHLPTTRSQPRLDAQRDLLIRNLDHAIVISPCMLRPFQELLGETRVSLIPHGIDTLIFHPPKERSFADRLQLLFVGEHMRDFEALHRIADALALNRIPASLTVVARPHVRSWLAGCDNVRLVSGISETTLVDLYQRSHLLLLPLTNATANNSILEALACGLPLISTNVGGISYYVGEKAGWLFPEGEVDMVVDQIVKLERERDLLAEASHAARKQAQHFSWERVGMQLLELYSSASNPTRKRTLPAPEPS